MPTPPPKITIYTDGSSRGNPGPGGFGTLLIAGSKRKEISVGYQRTTNNRMELLAAIAGLEVLKRTSSVTLYSDSKYVIDAINKGWLRGWKRRGWIKSDKKPIKNIDLWKRLDAASADHEITWKWVKGHAGNPNNERCDELATSAADSGNLRPDRGFEQQVDPPGLDL
ncbi:MAG: ribonuclease HI [Verrucomicrobiales bacterium]